jgi:2-oxoglutarate ferredoxin oxidoreductase subunit alpha
MGRAARRSLKEVSTVRTNSLSFLAGGFAGQGVKTVGDALGRICSRAGLHVFINQEYPSNIKGEHNYSHVMVSENEVRSQVGPIDVLLALDKKSVFLHQDEIAPGGALMYDSEGLEVSPIDRKLGDVEIKRNDIVVIDLPMKQIAEDVGGSKRMINSIGLGGVLGLLRFDFDRLEAMLRESLAKLGDEKLGMNIEGAKRAYERVREKFGERFGVTLEARDALPRMLLTGNDAMALGILKAGIKFYSGYPMTPASALLSLTAKNARDYGLVSILTEDEISAAGMVVGAALAGIRAMTGTSGGGFCLMSEFLGLAGMCEIPIVILEGQRPGPATGLPTRTEQGDLKFVLSAHQGEFPRIVIAPGDPPEAFYLSFEAFNLAERYQTPVIIFTDKHIGECSWTYEPFDTKGMKIERGEVVGEKEIKKDNDYKRFMITDSGISPRVLPGTPGGVHKATGNEHTEYGYPSEEPENRTAQVAKRLRKLDALDVSAFGYKLHGDPEADVTLVGWGSTKPVILDAMDLLKSRRDLNCNFLQIVYLSPFPTNPVAEILQNAKQTILVENNATAQLGDVIRERTGVWIEDKVLKWNGRQFLRDELADSIEEKL